MKADHTGAFDPGRFALLTTSATLTDEFLDVVLLNVMSASLDRSQCLYRPVSAYTCSQPVDPGRSCGSSISLRWYYDAVSHTCRSFQYLGCDGNSNNFVAEKDCRSYCTVGGTKRKPPFLPSLSRFCTHLQSAQMAVSLTRSPMVRLGFAAIRPTVR